MAWHKRLHVLRCLFCLPQKIKSAANCPVSAVSGSYKRWQISALHRNAANVTSARLHTVVEKLHCVRSTVGYFNLSHPSDHTVKECQMFFFCFEMPITLLERWAEKFQKQYQNQQNVMCQTVNNFKLSLTYFVGNVYQIVLRWLYNYTCS